MSVQAITVIKNIGPILARSLYFIFAAMVVVMAVRFQSPKIIGAVSSPSDFHAFYISGRMFWEGTLESAYRYEEFARAQERFFGEVDGFLAWSYPPPFNLITSVLAVMPIGLSYFLFISATLISYILTIRAISPRYFVGAIFAVLPAIILNIRLGQNGLLTGTLVGFFLLAFMRQRAGAGLSLGLMVIKPHLAAGIAVITLIGRRWASIGLASATVASVVALTTVVFGFSIWLAFLHGAMEASIFLKIGAYALDRMTSVYAALCTFGVSAEVALTIQVISALIACSAIAMTYIRIRNSMHVIGITAAASLYVSPYSFDYDMTLLGISVAAFLPEVSRRASNIELVVLFILCWVSCGLAYFFKVILASFGVSPAGDQVMSFYSVSSISLTILLAMSARIINRQSSV